MRPHNPNNPKTPPVHIHKRKRGIQDPDSSKDCWAPVANNDENASPNTKLKRIEREIREVQHKYTQTRFFEGSTHRGQVLCRLYQEVINEKEGELKIFQAQTTRPRVDLRAIVPLQGRFNIGLFGAVENQNNVENHEEDGLTTPEDNSIGSGYSTPTL